MEYHRARYTDPHFLRYTCCTYLIKQYSSIKPNNNAREGRLDTCLEGKKSRMMVNHLNSEKIYVITLGPGNLLEIHYATI